MLFGHLYVFFGQSFEKCLFRSFSHFLIWLFVFLVLNCTSRLYILEILCQLFPLLFLSHSEGCLSILFMISFAVQKLLSLIMFHLFVFVFIFTKILIILKYYKVLYYFLICTC